LSLATVIVVLANLLRTSGTVSFFGEGSVYTVSVVYLVLLSTLDIVILTASSLALLREPSDDTSIS